MRISNNISVILLFSELKEEEEKQFKIFDFDFINIIILFLYLIFIRYLFELLRIN